MDSQSAKRITLPSKSHPVLSAMPDVGISYSVHSWPVDTKCDLSPLYLFERGNWGELVSVS